MRSHSRQSLYGILPLLVLIVGAAPALAGQVSLASDSPDTAITPAGYLLYYWQEPTGDPQSVDVGLQTHVYADGPRRRRHLHFCGHRLRCRGQRE